MRIEEVELCGGKSGRLCCVWPLTCVQAGAGAHAMSLDLDLAQVLFYSHTSGPGFLHCLTLAHLQLLPRSFLPDSRVVARL
jgi:hypothetical protein